MPDLFVIDSDNSATTINLDDIANQLREQISKTGAPKAKQALTLPAQVGVKQALLVVSGLDEQHVHDDGDLVFSVIEGGGYVELLNGDPIPTPAGTTILVPKGVSHAYQNTSTDSVLLATVYPTATKDVGQTES
jgi:oxalate decarboxylase/phosphoglucose isomerase-like protein (cupin superfamily)